ncbi:MAG TPA: MFS transporter [Clostridiaceae bacterium]|jgi:MFS family permease|nr:MFS transporter [Clostridia bacterium]MED9924196.1 MFS transporter [Clostridia bacterium]CDC06276.1 unknown [Clostridium sp. CAG:343]HCF35126.1 MFS transporter [Clostridiales bacterium]HJJ18146.1 MFS transporter [Clostridiaceae bacterium]
MKEYFYRREYKYMYASIFFYNFAYALIETFGTVMLYQAGLPIYMILLIYGMRFLITGLITPLFVTISNKIGVAKCVLISNIFSIINSYFMLNSENLYSNIIIFIIAMGLMGLSNPSSDSLSNKYVESKHRGRFNSIYFISKILGIVLASVLVAWGIISNNKVVLLSIITIFYILQYIVILQIDYKPEKKTNTFKSSIKYLLHSKSKYKIIYALRANHIIERLFVPLYLYIALKDFKAFSVVVVISLLFQIITVTLIGKYTDKNIKKANTLVSLIRLIITSIYLFAKNKFVISVNKTVSDNLEKVYETSIQTSIQNMIKESKEDHDLLSAVGQMSLCFAEVVILAILSIISKYIGEDIFYLIFLLSIISTAVINFQIIKEEKD